MKPTKSTPLGGESPGTDRTYQCPESVAVGVGCDVRRTAITSYAIRVPELLQPECNRSSAILIHRYEGTVTQFLGDGVMSLFGAPIAHEDSARRAVAAALEMQESLDEYAADVKRRHRIEGG